MKTLLALGDFFSEFNTNDFEPVTRSSSNPGVWIFVVLAIALVAVLLFLRFVPLGLWITALSSGVHVSIGSLVGMRLRRIQPRMLVNPLIKARKAGLDVTLPMLETHYLAGGNVDKVINALIAAQRSNIELPFEKASAIDLAGRDVLQAVQMSVTPKVIETPVVAAIAKDGIELRAKARVTVPHSPKSSHPLPLPLSPKVWYTHLCLFSCLAYRVVIAIFLNSIYMC